MLIWTGPDGREERAKLDPQAIRQLTARERALTDALAVFILDSAIRRVLIETDPKAFYRAVDALRLYGVIRDPDCDGPCLPGDPCAVHVGRAVPPDPDDDAMPCPYCNDNGLCGNCFPWSEVDE